MLMLRLLTITLNPGARSIHLSRGARPCFDFFCAVQRASGTQPGIRRVLLLQLFQKAGAFFHFYRAQPQVQRAVAG